MSLESDTEDSSQASKNHGVAVCQKTAMNQAYCFFSEDHRYLQFSAVNNYLRYFVYDGIHFLPLSLRKNWRLYHPTAPLVDGEAAVQGNLNEHAALRRTQDPRIPPPPTYIMSQPAPRDHYLLPSWEHTSPITSSGPDFAALAPTVPEPHAPPVPPSAPSPNVDINTIIQAIVQGTLVENAASVAANTPAPSPAPTLSQPAGGHQPSASDNFFLKVWNGDQDSFPIFQSHISAWFESPSFGRRGSGRPRQYK